jgi:5'-nucleotidase/UDP-sugar diphosphatase
MAQRWRSRWVLPAAAVAALALAGCGDDGETPPDAALNLDAALADGTSPEMGEIQETGPALDGTGGEAGADASGVDASMVSDRVVILHTNDLHDQLMGFEPTADYSPATTGDDSAKGGFARLAAAINKERAAAKNVPVLLLDGGDFLVGSLFTWLNPTKAPTLTLMQAMGYDAITLGNHEFEWTSPVLAKTISAAVAAGFKVPILTSNIKFDAVKTGDDGLEQLWSAGTLRSKVVRTLPGGLKVGLFGLMGKTAASVTHNKEPITFKDQVATAKQLIQQLRTVDKVDLVICLSHSGVDTAGKGDDASLAAAAPGIDVIVSGHTHVTLAQPVKVGKTLIVMAGKYAQHLGRLELKVSGGTVTPLSYTLIPIDDQTAGDSTVQGSVDAYIKEIDKQATSLKAAHSMSVAETTFDLKRALVGESTVGNLVTDAYRFAATTAEPLKPAELAFENNGVIRAELLKGKTGQLWFADLYRVMPMGTGKDGSPGYPLVSFYLTGKELKTWFELMPLAKLLNQKNLYFQFSGAKVTYQKLALPMAAVKSATLTDTGKAINLSDGTTCHKVVSNVMVSEQLAMAGKYSLGLVKIEPKAADCKTKITDLWQHTIDRDPIAAGVQELKHWRAIFDYASQFADTDKDGVPNVPSTYAKTEGRLLGK